MKRNLLTTFAAIGGIWFSAQATADPTYKLGLIKQFNYRYFSTEIQAINDSGQMVGDYYYNSVNGTTYRGMLMTGFDRNDTSKLITFKQVSLSLNGSQILGISSNGLIAGYGEFPNLLSPGTLQSRGLYGQIGSPYKSVPFSHDTFSYASGINAKGFVTSVVGNGPVNSYIIAPNGIKTLVAVPGYSPNYTLAASINDTGDVAGYFYPDPKNTTFTKGFIRHADGTFTIVAPTVPGNRVFYTRINGINKQGDVVGEVGIPYLSSTIPLPFLRTADGQVQFFHYLITLNGLDSADDLVGSIQTSLGGGSDAVILIPDPVTTTPKGTPR